MRVLLRSSTSGLVSKVRLLGPPGNAAVGGGRVSSLVAAGGFVVVLSRKQQTGVSAAARSPRHSDQPPGEGVAGDAQRSRKL
jgi:hypothetical protein